MSSGKGRTGRRREDEGGRAMAVGFVVGEEGSAGA